MPIYTFKCNDGHETDKLLQGNSDLFDLDCPDCGGAAKRLDFYSVRSILQGAGIIPDSEPEYQNEADKKALKRDKDWDGDRAVEHIRKHMVERPSDGGKMLDVAAMNAGL